MNSQAMKTFLADFFAKRTWLVLAAPIVLGLALVTNVSQDGGGPNTAAIGLLILLAGAVVTLGLNLAGYDAQSGPIAEQISPSDSGQALVERWMRRSRYYRYVGGAVGFVLGVGFMVNGDASPALLGLLGGIALGGAMAELHVLRRRGDGARVADMSVRNVDDYTLRSDSIALAVAALGGLFLGAISLFGSADGGLVPLAWGATAITVVIAVMALQRLVVTRARPALSADMREADDVLRYLAATQGFTRPAIAVALLSLAFGVASLGDDLDLLVLALGVGGIVWYVRSRQTSIPDLVRMAAR